MSDDVSIRHCRSGSDCETEMKQQRNLLKTLQSVLWAFLGVRATSKAEDDFKAPHPWVYVIIGVVLVALLVLSLALIVRAVAL